MPLSEHEQRLLAEMEKQLHEDPHFTDSLRQAESAGRYSTRNIAVGLLIAVVGLALVLVGVSLNHLAVIGIVVGVVGFLLMSAGVYVALAKRPGTPGSAESPAPQNARKSSYMERLEQQWEDRHRGDGR